MSITAAERDSADAYAAQDHKEPLFSSGEHLRAAWDLAGRVKGGNAAAIRARIIAFAKKHGLMGRLPKSAQTQKGDVVAPARESRVATLLRLAYHHESMENDVSQKRRLIEYAQANGIADSLPEEAHGDMHDFGMEHDHGDGKLKHVHIVRKAYEPVGKSITIEKAWFNEDGTATIEGWVSTPDPDREHDVVEPEAFLHAVDGYVSRSMPLSSEHQLKALPIGHGQRVALVRDGKVFKEVSHPSDPANFEHFPGTGSGVYGRFVINDPQHATAVKAKNIGGFSWVGNLTEYEPLPTGGRRFLKIEPWLESTVAAYPINGKAVVLAAKAALEAELAPQLEEQSVEDQLIALLEGARAADERERQGQAPVSAVTKAELDEFFAKLTGAVDQKIAAAVEQVQKASDDRQGVGRLGAGPEVKPEDDREGHPISYAIKKAAEAAEGKKISQDDKDLIAGLTMRALSEGMTVF